MGSEQSVWNIVNVESINEVSIIPPFQRAYCLHAGRSVLVRATPAAGIVRVITKQSARQAPVLNSLSYHPVFKNQDQGLHCKRNHQNTNIHKLPYIPMISNVQVIKNPDMCQTVSEILEVLIIFLI